MNSEQEKTTYYVEALDWDQQKREAERRSGVMKTRIAWTCGVIAAAAVLSNAALWPLKQVIPAIIRVDNATGAYDVQTPGETLKLSEQRNQKIVIADVGRYVMAREGFTRGEAESNYRTVYFMSCGPVRGEWNEYFNPELNPSSPVKTMLPTDSERVDIQNYTFLPTDTDDLRVVQVRFDKTVAKGVASPVKTRYIATMTIKYDKTNIPLLTKDQHVNPFGFCVINYRRDQEGAPVVLGSSSPSELQPTAAQAASALVPSPVAQERGTPPALAVPVAPITPANIGLQQEGGR
jgi:type IV secretion system protein VirB8